jgi:hypothetical protein
MFNSQREENIKDDLNKSRIPTCMGDSTKKHKSLVFRIVRNALLRKTLELNLGCISVKANCTEIYEYFLKLNAFKHSRRKKRKNIPRYQH